MEGRYVKMSILNERYPKSQLVLSLSSSLMKLVRIVDGVSEGGVLTNNLSCSSSERSPSSQKLLLPLRLPHVVNHARSTLAQYRPIRATSLIHGCP